MPVYLLYTGKGSIFVSVLLISGDVCPGYVPSFLEFLHLAMIRGWAA